ncbi:uncharacterized protein LOC116211912 [Punica granatum]|uniref:Uncharacterized protein n=2 Tax=Punica granatum TaxID=22663 RepID=A0A218X8K1_PUNGR|nr:uncharacterized protein LOC116211912 [Punica granatum]OWM81277.1 hypothetical protein CDL15_Pgr007315 [Punica granatum]PKI67703.1 hypothetical protein CRG98_011916 [Punica granatum]
MNPVGRVPTHAKALRRAPPGGKSQVMERRPVAPGWRRRTWREVQEISSAASVYGDASVSARKLAAQLWRRPEHLLAAASGGTKGGLQGSGDDELGFQDVPASYFESEIEGVTKWSPAWVETNGMFTSSAVSALKCELEQARARIRELEATPCCCEKEKLEHLRRETLGDDIRAEMGNGRTCKIVERADSRLVDELVEAKLSVKWLVHCHMAERKERELTEQLCREQAMKIKEAEEMKREFKRFLKEEEEDREMLRVAAAWREERLQLQLLDARLALEEKYSQLNALVADLERFLGSRGIGEGTGREGEELREAVESLNIKDVKELSYEPDSPNNVSPARDEDANYGENDASEIEPVFFSSPASVLNNLNAIISHKCDVEDRRNGMVSGTELRP